MSVCSTSSLAVSRSPTSPSAATASSAPTRPTRGPARSTAAACSPCPGFIDTHLHVESSLVTPQEFDRCVLPHGVTTAICDPHEIANVLGLEGIRYFLDSAETTIMDLRVQLSSCVPATTFETSGAELLAEDLLPLAHPSQGDRPRRVHEFPRRAVQPRRRARQAGRVPGRAHRRPRAAGARLRPQRLPCRPHPHRPRDDHRRRRPREAEKGHRRPHPRRLGHQGPARAGRDSRRAHVELLLPVHRRPQPARHRRRGPPRLHDPHADRPRPAAPPRLSRRKLVGGRTPSASATAA